MFAQANNILQAENNDLSTGMTFVSPSVETIHHLRTENKFCDIWDELVTQIDAHSRRTRRDNTLLRDYVVEETTENNKMNEEEILRLFYSTLDQIINEIDVRFCHQNTKLCAAVSALHPENSYFRSHKCGGKI